MESWSSAFHFLVSFPLDFEPSSLSDFWVCILLEIFSTIFSDLSSGTQYLSTSKIGSTLKYILKYLVWYSRPNSWVLESHKVILNYYCIRDFNIVFLSHSNLGLLFIIILFENFMRRLYEKYLYWNFPYCKCDSIKPPKKITDNVFIVKALFLRVLSIGEFLFRKPYSSEILPSAHHTLYPSILKDCNIVSLF